MWIQKGPMRQKASSCVGKIAQTGTTCSNKIQAFFPVEDKCSIYNSKMFYCTSDVFNFPFYPVSTFCIRNIGAIYYPLSSLDYIIHSNPKTSELFKIRTKATLS